MSQDVKSGKILSPSTPWTERGVPGIQVPDEQTSLKATFTEPTIECPECHALVTRTAMSFNAYVCPQCDEHLRMKARDRLNWFFDQVQTELGQEFKAKDPLKFVDSKPYPARMTEAQTKTGETEALVVMQGLLKGIPLIACAFEFDFMGGSMGTVVGDRFVQAAEKAIADKQPLICFAASGGARMQEGMLSLMQMARTSAAIQKMKDAGLPYLVVFSNIFVANNTVAIILSGDMAREVAKEYGVDPKRAAALLDIFSCVVQGLIPYGAQLLLACSIAKLSPVELIGSIYYCWILAIFAILAIAFRFPRLKSV
jgi:acetyl-CoA carboxylase carboxyl transferase subunit beta